MTTRHLKLLKKMKPRLRERKRRSKDKWNLKTLIRYLKLLKINNLKVLSLLDQLLAVKKKLLTSTIKINKLKIKTKLQI